MLVQLNQYTLVTASHKFQDLVTCIVSPFLRIHEHVQHMKESMKQHLNHTHLACKSYKHFAKRPRLII